MTIQLTQPRVVNGSVATAGTQFTLTEAMEAYFITSGWATRVGAAPNQRGVSLAAWNADGTGLIDPETGGSFLRGEMTSGAWMTVPSIFRLRLTGTGTVTLDSRDSLGNITAAVASYTASGATDQIEFPYAGDNAVAIRATLTGTTTAEVI